MPTIVWNANAHDVDRRSVVGRHRVQALHRRVRVVEREQRQQSGIAIP